jgi:hypothetical protein
MCTHVCMFISAGRIIKLCAGGGGGHSYCFSLCRKSGDRKAAITAWPSSLTITYFVSRLPPRRREFIARRGGRELMK